MKAAAAGPIRRHISMGKGDLPLRPPQPAVRRIPAADRWDRRGALRRARRRADASQRDMAERIGVSPATVARAESADGSVSFAVIEAILAEGGLRLVAVDVSGELIAPMRTDAARNHGGSRYPAHLDARIPTPSDEPIGGWRRDRPKPRLTFNHRPWRDVRRLRRCVIPRDHSTEIDLRLCRHLRRPRPEWMRRILAERRQRIVLEVCRCGPECVTNCVPDCPCQCEPIGWDTLDLGLSDDGLSDDGLSDDGLRDDSPRDDL